MWVQPINQFNLLNSRPFLQLGFSSDRITNITVMLVVDHLLHRYLEANPVGSLSMLPNPPGKQIRYINVQTRVMAIRNDIDSEVIVTWHDRKLEMSQPRSI